MPAKLIIRGVDTLLADLARLAPDLTREAGHLQHASATAAAADVRAAYPAVTGRLRQSVQVARLTSQSPARVYTEVTVTAPYAHFVEFGTARTAPNPAFVPITRRAREDFVDRIIARVEGRGLVVGGALTNG